MIFSNFDERNWRYAEKTPQRFLWAIWYSSSHYIWGWHSSSHYWYFRSRFNRVLLTSRVTLLAPITSGVNTHALVRSGDDMSFLVSNPRLIALVSWGRISLLLLYPGQFFRSSFGSRTAVNCFGNIFRGIPNACMKNERVRACTNECMHVCTSLNEHAQLCNWVCACIW